MFDSWIQKQSLLNENVPMDNSKYFKAKNLNLKQNIKNDNNPIKDNHRGTNKII